MLRQSATQLAKRAVPTVAQTTLPIVGTDELFPIRRVFCVGQNYASHAAEMGAPHTAARKEPFFFTKPADAVTTAATMPYPTKTNDLHHEVELVAAIGKGGKDIPAASVSDHLFGFAVGIDLTKRDKQLIAKETGKPWDMWKGFDNSAPCSEIVPLPAEAKHYTEFLPLSSKITLHINGEVRQQDNLSSMIWNVEELISILSTYVELQPGDLVYTGTPSGVGSIQRGDKVVAEVEGVAVLNLTVTNE